MREIEIRTFAGAPTLREADPVAEDTGSVIEGYAAVFNVLSEDMGFREIMMPGAFDRALSEGHDVRALINHDSNLILGRTKSGTLKLAVDEHGLLASINPPDTQVARDCVTSIKRGDLDGMSFAFITIADDFKTVDGEVVREVSDLELVDVSIVAFPAYAATQVSARALALVAKAKTPAPRLVPNDVNAARLRMAR